MKKPACDIASFRAAVYDHYVDNDDYAFAGLIIDTDAIEPAQIVELIVEKSRA